MRGRYEKVFGDFYNYSVFFSDTLLADDTKALNYLLLGRQPSARAEAMGKGMDVLTYDPNTAFYNPANLARNDYMSFGASYASPYYLTEDAFYTNYLISSSLGKFGSVSLSRFDFDLGERYYELDLAGNTISSQNYNQTFYMLSYAKAIPGGFYAGINVNLAQLRIHKTFNAFPVDAGIIKHLNIVKNDFLEYEAAAGISLTNIFNTSLEYESVVSDNKISSELPSLMRVGLSNKFAYNGIRPIENLNFLSMIFHIEYQNLINSPIRKGYRIGSELSVLELLYLRAGFYEETNDRNNVPENKDYLNSFTYGFGIRAPLQELHILDIPLAIRFDYTQLEQPSRTHNVEEWDDFKSWNINIFLNLDVFKFQ